METCGSKVVSSGNTFQWRGTEIGDRGCIVGTFIRRPTEADIAEAQDFIASLVPEGSSAGPATTGTQSQMIEKANDHFTHNAKHN